MSHIETRRRVADIVDAHEWSRFGGSIGEQIAEKLADAGLLVDAPSASKCIHGPGVAECGHPDCVGERDAAAGLLVTFEPEGGWATAVQEQCRKSAALLASLPQNIRDAL